MNNELQASALLLVETNSVVSGELFDRYICTMCSERCDFLVFAGSQCTKLFCRNVEARARRSK